MTCELLPDRASEDAAEGSAHSLGSAPEEMSPGDANEAGAPATRRVLLLEDDPSFKEIITVFLTESGYTVTAVQNGVEGVRAVLVGEYAAILCDMMMPTLPGDRFYRAVERARPDLCARFVFMTGHRGDEKINAFMASITGFVIRKPFKMQDLLDSMAFAEVRGTYRSVCESEPTDPAPVLARSPEGLRSPGLAPPLRASAVAQIRTPLHKSAPLPAAESTKPAQEALSPPRLEPTTEKEQKKPASFGFLPWVALVLASAAIPASGYLDLRARVAGSSAELRFWEEQWTIASAQLQEGEEKRAAAEAAVRHVEQIVAHSREPGWAQALPSLTEAGAANAEVRDIEVRAEPGIPSAFLLRITGVSTGHEPRAVADEFRRRLEENLQLGFADASVTSAFERLEEAAPASSELAAAQKPQAAFTILARTGGRGKP